MLDIVDILGVGFEASRPPLRQEGDQLALRCWRAALTSGHLRRGLVPCGRAAAILSGAKRSPRTRSRRTCAWSPSAWAASRNGCERDYSRKKIKDDLHNLREDVSDRLKDIEKWRHEADISDARRAWIDRVVSEPSEGARVRLLVVPALARGFALAIGPNHREDR